MQHWVHRAVDAGIVALTIIIVTVAVAWAVVHPKGAWWVHVLWIGVPLLGAVIRVQVDKACVACKELINKGK